MQPSLNFAFVIDLLQSNACINATQLINQLGMESVEGLDQALQHAAEVRALKTEPQHYYIAQNTNAPNSLSHLFLPFISAVLNLKTVYISSRNKLIEQVYPHYFPLEALALQKRQSINEMNLCFDLLADHFQAKDIQLYALCKALLDPNCQQVYMLGELEYSSFLIDTLKTLAHIEIINIALYETEQDLNKINFKQLFWKTKNNESTIACHHIAHANAPLLSQLLQIPSDKAAHLIDDLLYSEHIFEKLSVFGEFTETILKHHHLSASGALV